MNIIQDFIDWIRNASSKCKYYYHCKLSRNKALAIRKELIQNKEVSVVDRSIKRKIKIYCKNTFGSKSYWPWIALYTEIRGKYVEGWIPADYLHYYVFPRLNPLLLADICLCKTFDYRIFGDLCVRPVLVIIDHLVFDPEYNLITVKQASSLLKKMNTEVVIKEDGGTRGNKVIFKQASEVVLENYIGKGRFLIQPAIQQHASLAEIYPISFNTLRVLTYMDSQSRVNVIALIVKFGAGGNRLDNFALGGRFIYLDEEGNTISDAITGKGFETEKSHPDSGRFYKNLKVPSIDLVIEVCTEAHYKYPYLSIIGWDVIIDKTGHPMIIEWNASKPAMWYNEAYIGPLFDVREIQDRLSAIDAQK